MYAKFYIGHETTVDTDSKLLYTEIVKHLSVDNPEYAQRKRAGKWLGGTPEHIALYKNIGGRLIIPYGATLMFIEVAKAIGIAPEVKPDAHIENPRHRIELFVPVDGLYDYQEEAVGRVKSGLCGVLVAPCGSGKTQMGLAIAGRMGVRTLWLTHTHALLKQSMSRAESLGFKKEHIGTITEGKIDVGYGITFATVQTMAKIDLSQIREAFDMIIVDECHKAVGTPTKMTMFWKVISGLSARYKFGLTATPKRADGLEKAMYALIGPKLFEVTKDKVEDKTCELVVMTASTNWNPKFEKLLNPDGTLSYTKLITECICDDGRNETLLGVIEGCASHGATMVLSERVAHLEYLQAMIGEGVCLSTSKKKEREGAIEKIKRGEERIIFATYQLAKEGLDIPCLMYLVMATPIKDEISVTQSVGRVMRAYPGKQFGTVWDFEDENVLMLKRWHRKRLSIYRRFEKDV